MGTIVKNKKPREQQYIRNLADAMLAGDGYCADWRSIEDFPSIIDEFYLSEAQRLLEANLAAAKGRVSR